MPFRAHSSVPRKPDLDHLAHILTLSCTAFLVKDLKLDMNVIFKLKLHAPLRCSYIIAHSVISSIVPALIFFLSCTDMPASSPIIWIHELWFRLRVPIADSDVSLAAPALSHATSCVTF